MLVYAGQSQEAPGRAGGDAGVVSAADLARHDVVLTTYEVLRAELHLHSDTAAGDATRGSLRYRKKYDVIPTPLPRLVWWRVCLDEAQMVEGSATKAAEMALRLRSVNRWCVTGTPISRGVEDLFGLLLFLGARPLSDKHVWARAIAGAESGSA